METLIVHPENKEQLSALKAFMKALRIRFVKKESLKQDYSETEPLQKLQQVIDAGADIASFGDPSLWQKKVRQDRLIPNK